MSVDLYDTEVLVTAAVTGITSSGNQSTLTLGTPLPADPLPDSPYILATVSSQAKRVRIRGIKRNGEQKFTLSAIDYDPAVYDIPLPNDLLPTTSGGSAGNTASTPDPTTTPPAAPPTDVVNPGDPGYGGSSVPSGSGGYVYGETPSGTINGSNATFTLANTPIPAASLLLYLNGLRLRLGVDYTLSGSTITMIAIPQTGDNLVADYRY
jgi:hypothetical protein